MPRNLSFSLGLDVFRVFLPEMILFDIFPFSID